LLLCKMKVAFAFAVCLCALLSIANSQSAYTHTVSGILIEGKPSVDGPLSLPIFHNGGKFNLTLQTLSYVQTEYSVLVCIGENVSPPLNGEGWPEADSCDYFHEFKQKQEGAGTSASTTVKASLGSGYFYLGVFSSVSMPIHFNVTQSSIKCDGDNIGKDCTQTVSGDVSIRKTMTEPDFEVTVNPSGWTYYRLHVPNNNVEWSISAPSPHPDLVVYCRRGNTPIVPGQYGPGKKYKFSSVNKDGAISISIHYPGPTEGALAFWYLGFFNNQSSSYTLKFHTTKVTVCDNTRMGADCSHEATLLNTHLDGAPITRTVKNGEWQYFILEVTKPNQFKGFFLDVSVPGDHPVPTVYMRVGNAATANNQWGVRGCNTDCPKNTARMFTLTPRVTVYWVAVVGNCELDPQQYHLSIIPRYHEAVHIAFEDKEKGYTIM